MFFVLGAVMGSVANAIIDRLPRNEAWSKGRSHCDKCNHSLGLFDLIPLISFLTLAGKCRYCKKQIPKRNFVVELFLGLGFLVISRIGHMGLIGQILLMGMLWVTTIIAVMDWETKLVSELLVFVWWILVVFQLNSFSVLQLTGLIAGVGVIGGIWAVTRGRAMGFGDVEIVAVMGWWLGWPKIGVALWMAFVVGAIFGIYHLTFRQLKLKSEIAFGPFLILGTWVAYFGGETIIKLLNF